MQDGLLSMGNRDLIMRIYNKIPKFSSDGKRLQVSVVTACYFGIYVKTALTYINCNVN